MRLLFICTLIVGFTNVTLAQDEDRKALSSLESELLFYGDVMVNAYESSSRLRAASEFESLFQKYLDSQLAFSREAEFHKFISILDAPDNTFKLITWMQRISDQSTDYSGYILSQNGNYTRLIRTESVTEDLEYSECTSESWYGCHYYRIMKSERDYLLFGFDSNGKYDNQKIVDILSFDDNQIRFGKPVFEDKEDLGTYKNRLILSFSSDASVYLNFDSDLKMIVHDHLEPRLGLQPGQGPTNIPDGTYEGYKFKKGKWNYNKKLFDHVYETAPRPKPVFVTPQDEEKN